MHHVVFPDMIVNRYWIWLTCLLSLGLSVLVILDKEKYRSMVVAVALLVPVIILGYVSIVTGWP